MLTRAAIWDDEVAQACAPGCTRGWPGELTARQYLSALAAHLRGLKMAVQENDTNVLVADSECSGVEVRVLCRPRPSDWDRLWYWDAEGAPLAEAEHAHDAVTEIRRRLAQPPAKAAS
ncbi:hypothetical protein AB0L06_32410 [Spirillospora sp. NPDC052269]